MAAENYQADSLARCAYNMDTRWALYYISKLNGLDPVELGLFRPMGLMPPPLFYVGRWTRTPSVGCLAQSRKMTAHEETRCHLTTGTEAETLNARTARRTASEWQARGRAFDMREDLFFSNRIMETAPCACNKSNQQRLGGGCTS